jgi:aminoglycoside phosphotransferase family enzyme/predicted kinase
MAAGDQTPVIEFLASPAAHGGGPVERIDTHTAVVFLAGDRAFKLKRAVRYDYFDASTVERRRALSDAELALNRRMAPDLYLGVRAVTREPDGTLALDGSGEAVDWVIEMRRFDQEALFDRLAEAGRLDLALMPPLADAIAAFHREAAPRPDHGGEAGMRWVIEGNRTAFDEAACLDAAAGRRVSDLARAELDRRSALLEERRAGGFVRQCHGDLHLRNIVLIDGSPTLFDGVEFNDRIACTDVLYDFAFLLMDLWRRRLSRHANAVWNRYLLRTGDFAAGLLPLFLSCRAAVRAKTSATAAGFQAEPRRREALEATAREYLAMAERLIRPPAPCLIAVGGRSGSGKSTLALSLAPSVGAPPGAVVLRSDEIRKQLLKKPLLEPLGPEGYAGWVSMRVYAILAERARRVLAGGHSVIADAVYSSTTERKAIEAVAIEAGVPFVGLWLEASPEVLIARASGRQRDASDADAEVVRRQLARSTGRIGWHRLDTSGSADDVLAQASTRVRACASA